jgi:hypothetical protein
MGILGFMGTITLSNRPWYSALSTFHSSLFTFHSKRSEADLTVVLGEPKVHSNGFRMRRCRCLCG